MRYAMIDTSGVVENVIVWDGETDYEPPEGMTLLSCVPEVSIGWTYGNGAFTPPDVVEDEPLNAVIAE